MSIWYKVHTAVLCIICICMCIVELVIIQNILLAPPFSKSYCTILILFVFGKPNREDESLALISEVQPGLSGEIRPGCRGVSVGFCASQVSNSHGTAQPAGWSSPLCYGQQKAWQLERAAGLNAFLTAIPEFSVGRQGQMGDMGGEAPHHEGFTKDFSQ